MEQTTQTCKRCGAVLAATAWSRVCPACLLRAGLTEEAGPHPDGAGAPEFASLAGRGFRDYELLEEIARGGMGVVYRARQISLNRIVALKRILRGALAQESELKRFRAEAELAALLQHPNIVAIHEVGEQDGEPFFSMDYVEGRSLADVARNEPLPARRAAAYLKTIAEAVQYAHSKGILHRDLKPSNILIDQSDQPRITDFGLAKRLISDLQPSTADLRLTLTGQVLGSPNFMPPEQARGERGAVGPASDVYSLGAILYQLVTGRPPFMAETLAQTLRLVAETDPISPRLLSPSVPRDLETICLKCLDRNPPRRYATARALAKDLGLFLGDEPILARPANAVERAWRWGHRHPAVAALSTVVLALLLTVAVGSTLHVARLKEANQRATDRLWEAYVGQAQAERWSGRAGRRSKGLELLSKAAEIRASAEIRNEAIACLALEDVHTVKAWKLAEASQFQFDQKYDRYCLLDRGGLCVRRVNDDHELARWTDPGAQSFRFSPDGRYLASNNLEGSNRWLHVYQLERREKIVSLPTGSFRGCAFSADGNRLFVINTSPAVVSVVSLPSGKEEKLFETSFVPFGFVVTQKGDRLAVSSEQSRDVEIRDAISGRLLFPLSNPDFVRGLDWQPNGRYLAAACGDGKIYVWDTTTRQVRSIMSGHDRLVLGVNFSSDGNRLGSSSWDNTFRLWNVWTGRQIISRPSFGGIYAFSTGDHFVGLLGPHSVELCKLTGRREWRAFYPEGSATEGWQCAWSPDGRLLAAGFKDWLRLWDTASGRESSIRLRAQGECWGVTFDPTGAYLIAGTSSGLRCWPTSWNHTGLGDSFLVGDEEKFGPEIGAGSLFWNTAGTILVTTCDRVVRIFEWPTRRQMNVLEMGPSTFGCALSPSGRLCVGWPYRGDLPRRVWDVATGNVLTNLVAHGIYGAAFTPDDCLLITGSNDEYVAWDTRSWSPIWKVSRPNSGGGHAQVALTRDGKIGALSISAQLIRLFDPTTGREFSTLEAPEQQTIDWLAFSPDGDRLAATTLASAVHLWDLRLLRQELAALKLDWDAPPFPPPNPSQAQGTISVVTPDRPTANPPESPMR